jgi:hypothetical protein
MKNRECDLQGREWALVSNLNEGDYVNVDDSFTCMKSNVRKKVKLGERCKGIINNKFEYENKLYISCSEGKHFLIGQYKNRDKTVEPFYLGIYKSY